LHIASNVKNIRHWKIKHCSYADIPNVKAHWFIDPPYQKAGTAYKCSSKDINFDHLGSWCMDRKGTVIVCENRGAEWLPFRDFYSATATPGKGRTGVSHEVIFSCKNL
jgi:16S rRNA G966 N2-methylase RsmD